jgi:ABC-2 type transport system permease protein
VFAIGGKQLLEYRADFFLMIAKYMLSVMITGAVWVTVAHEHPSATLNASQLLSYYCLAAMWYGFTNFHTWDLEADIYRGRLAKYLTRPTNVFWHYAAFALGGIMTGATLRIALLAVVVIALRISLTLSIGYLPIALAYLVLSFLFAYCFFTLCSSCAVWITQASSLRFIATFLFRFCSGLYAPLHLMPTLWQHILWWTPFPYAFYVPIQVLMGNYRSEQIVSSLLILASWTVIMFVANRIVWKIAMRAFEGVGI